MKSDTLINQYVAAIIQAGENEKQVLYQKAILDIAEQANIDVATAEESLKKALDCVANVRDFVSHIDHVLGNMKTKHGEIAEQLEAEVGNAYCYMEGTSPKYIIDKDVIGRTGPVDYIFNNIPVQSKFCDGAKNSLKEVLVHLDKYPDFGAEGFYMLPKDQYESIQKILHGDGTENLNAKSIDAIKASVEKICQKTGKSFEEMIHPSRFSYSDAQLGHVDIVLDSEEGKIINIHTENVEKIRKDAREKIEESKKLTQPSWNEALKYSFISGIISGTAEAATCIFSKIKAGKKISDFSTNDWKEIGIDFGKGGVKGGASAMSIYWLTNMYKCQASVASAMTSAVIGIGSLAVDYKKGKISQDEFVAGAYALSYESSVVAAGALVGQVVFPIPVLGAILGSTISKVAYDLTKKFFDGQENALVKEMENRYKSVDAQLQKEFNEYANSLDSYYQKLNSLITDSEQYDCYALLNSGKLCEKLGIVPLKTLKDVDDYMRS